MRDYHRVLESVGKEMGKVRPYVQRGEGPKLLRIWGSSVDENGREAIATEPLVSRATRQPWRTENTANCPYNVRTLFLVKRGPRLPQHAMSESSCALLANRSASSLLLPPTNAWI
jgi:hypothetical protein